MLLEDIKGLDEFLTKNGIDVENLSDKQKLKILKQMLFTLEVDLECEQEKFSNSRDEVISENISQIRKNYKETHCYIKAIQNIQQEKNKQIKEERKQRIVKCLGKLKRK